VCVVSGFCSAGASSWIQGVQPRGWQGGLVLISSSVCRLSRVASVQIGCDQRQMFKTSHPGGGQKLLLEFIGRAEIVKLSRGITPVPWSGSAAKQWQLRRRRAIGEPTAIPTSLPATKGTTRLHTQAGRYVGTRPRSMRRRQKWAGASTW